MTTTRQKAPCILTEVGARRLTARIRDALAVADDLLAQAYQGRAWEALGYDSWPAYCAGELPELRFLKLRAEARRERVRALRNEGATIPDVVAATGSSLGTIHRDLVSLEGGHTRGPSFQTETPEAQEPEAAPPVPMAKTDRVVALVASQGDRGMTNWQVVARHVTSRGGVGSTCLEFEDESEWRHGAASAAFHAAERKGVIRRDGRFRESYAVYV